MLKAGYNVKVSAGALTAGGCLGILIPPSVLLIVYGATAGVSVVQLYAGAFLPGFMLAFLYIGYLIVLAKWKPSLMPPLPESERRVPLPPRVQPLAARGGNALAASWRALVGQDRAGVPKRTVFAQFLVSLLPALAIAAIIVLSYRIGTAPEVQASTAGLVEAGGAIAADASQSEQSSGGLIGAPDEEPGQDQQAGELAPPPGAEAEKKPAAEAAPAPAATAAPAAAAATRVPAPTWFYVLLGIGIGAIVLVYWLWSWERLQVFKLLLTSFFPLALLILAVLGSIVVGLATPAEAAAVGAFGGFVLAWIYRFITHWRERPRGSSVGEVLGRTTKEFGRLIRESCFLTAKTSAMVCWLFVGSGIFSAAFALLGGQELIEKWVLSLDMTPLQFMILAQFIIFILGWPLEWTEIIIIFMPIFIPLLPHFTPAGFTPDQFALFFGLLVALNLQTAFLSPPVAMAAFYLKGVSPPHVTLNQIFAGMMPFMGIQVLAIVLLYMFPQIGLWLPSVFYAR
jgi:TRAP-type mannitol/chloroaromatic compound transport system permease large subunit